VPPGGRYRGNGCGVGEKSRLRGCIVIRLFYIEINFNFMIIIIYFFIFVLNVYFQNEIMGIKF